MQQLYMKADLDEKKLERALKKIAKIKNDQKIKEIAFHAPNTKVRIASFEKIAQNDLAIIAKDKKEDPLICKAAFDKITDNRILMGLIETADDKELRLNAVRKITDNTISARVAATASDAEVRLAAAKKISDPAIAEDLLSNVSNIGLGIYRYERGLRQDRVLVRDFDETILKVLLDKIPNDKVFSVLSTVIIRYRYAPEAVESCVKRIKDQDKLKYLLRCTGLGNARLIVYDKLIDPAIKNKLKPKMQIIKDAMEADEAELKACKDEQNVRNIKRKCVNMMIDHFTRRKKGGWGDKYEDHIDPDIVPTSEKFDAFERAYENYGKVFGELMKEMIDAGYKDAPTQVLKEYIYIVDHETTGASGLYGYYLLNHLGYLKEISSNTQWEKEHCIRTNP